MTTPTHLFQSAVARLEEAERRSQKAPEKMSSAWELEEERLAEERERRSQKAPPEKMSTPNRWPVEKQREFTEEREPKVQRLCQFDKTPFCQFEMKYPPAWKLLDETPEEREERERKEQKQREKMSPPTPMGFFREHFELADERERQAQKMSLAGKPAWKVEEEREEERERKEQKASEKMSVKRKPTPAEEQLAEERARSTRKTEHINFLRNSIGGENGYVNSIKDLHRPLDLVKASNDWYKTALWEAGQRRDSLNILHAEQKRTLSLVWNQRMNALAGAHQGELANVWRQAEWFHRRFEEMKRKLEEKEREGWENEYPCLGEVECNREDCFCRVMAGDDVEADWEVEQMEFVQEEKESGFCLDEDCSCGIMADDVEADWEVEYVDFVEGESAVFQ